MAIAPIVEAYRMYVLNSGILTGVAPSHLNFIPVSNLCYDL